METRLLEGAGVVITGASIGLGKAVARACLRHGASIFVCARDGPALETMRAQAAAEFGDSRVRAMAADVSNPASVDALFRSVERDLPNIVGIVNNAGVVGPVGPAE